MKITMDPVGMVSAAESGGFRLCLEKQFAGGLEGLEGFSHAVIVWYAHKMPPWDGKYLRIPKPYRLAPPTLGVFATRSPYRPNGVCVSMAEIISVDSMAGTVDLSWIDAEDGSPVLDLKPYHPSGDRIRDATLPGWCAGWPACFEESGAFAWDKEFLF